MCTKSQALEIMREAYSSCNTALMNNVREAYLYGSYARGDYDRESDIDILLTADMERDALTKYRGSIAKISSDLSLKHDVTVSVTVKPLSQFRQYKDVMPFYRNVIQEGIHYAG